MVESKTELMAYIGLGSNMGQREKNLRDAVSALGALPESRLGLVSSIYETEPWGIKNQADFYNQVVEIQTKLNPQALFEKCQQIEKKLGRLSKEKWGPRVIDIDILLYSDLRLDEKGLMIPHPKLTERRFVLVPLTEIASSQVVPGINKTVAKALEMCKDEGEVNLFSAVINKGGQRW